MDINITQEQCSRTTMSPHRQMDAWMGSVLKWYRDTDENELIKMNGNVTAIWITIESIRCCILSYMLLQWHPLYCHAAWMLAFASPRVLTCREKMLSSFFIFQLVNWHLILILKMNCVSNFYASFLSQPTWLIEWMGFFLFWHSHRRMEFTCIFLSEKGFFVNDFG